MNDADLIEEARRVTHDLARNALGERVPVIDMLADRLQDLLAAHDAEVRAAVLAEQGGPKWEYGRTYYDEGANPHTRTVTEADHAAHRPDGHRSDGSPYWNYTQVRRRKASPWLPVEDPS